MTLKMQIDKILEQRQLSTDNRQLKVSLSSTDNCQMTVDKVLDSYPQLVTEDFRPWHARQISRIGTNKYIELANRALKYGNNPAKLFSTMLKNY
jgi:hypothetical protein